jgi:hypothetical protein
MQPPLNKIQLYLVNPKKKKNSSVHSMIKAECAPCVQWKIPLLKQETGLLAAAIIWYQDNAK